jgi:hypothetical protein
MADVSRRRWLFAAGLVLAGCLSPTLPLPPPNKPDVQGPDQQGLVTLSGTTEAGATVFVENLRTGQVVGQKDLDADGLYQLVIGAELQDRVDLWYTLGSEESPHLIFEIE